MGQRSSIISGLWLRGGRGASEGICHDMPGLYLTGVPVRRGGRRRRDPSEAEEAETYRDTEPSTGEGYGGGLWRGRGRKMLEMEMLELRIIRKNQNMKITGKIMITKIKGYIDVSIGATLVTKEIRGKL